MRRGEQPEATDALFDTRPHAMAARYGGVVLNRLLTGREEVREAARLAFSYAGLALEEEERERRVLRFPYRNGEWS